ncbi:MAG: tRNA dihydrouridine synthase DusB [Coriobacteriaceae bacterium]|nr:tRNA dihydrouridine synthase DusB [Coriobacteriaceae bacterium]
MSTAPFAELFADRPLLLAPMAGVTDAVFRILCLEQGADLGYTEMVSTKGLSYANAKTRSLIERAPGEEQVAVQLFGHEPDTMAREAAWVCEHLGGALAYIDINMGCPARKIVRKGDGCALMCDPALARAVIAAVARAVDVPVTVKFRRGYRLGEELAVDFARMAQDAGAAAVAVHGRFAEQFYQGAADWQVVADVKSALVIPVIGNGDVRSGADAAALKAETACDAVMIGRAAQGNPWVFADTRAALRGEQAPAPPGVEARLAMARRHAQLLAQGGKGLVRMRKHAMWYVQGIPGAAKARGLISACVSLEDFDGVFKGLLEQAYRSGKAAHDA